MHLLGNECSAEFKERMVENKMEYQFVPPRDHRRNVAEKAIHVFKDHFVLVVCGSDAKIPMPLWCCILCQTEHKLDLLRKSRVEPSKSSFEVTNGKHDYNANSVVPLGYAVEMHVVPNKLRTREAHTKIDFYLGNSWEYYMCHEI